MNQRRIWQNPFYCEGWNEFWQLCNIMSLMLLFDRPQSSIIFYDGNCLHAREQAFNEFDKVLIKNLKKRGVREP